MADLSENKGTIFKNGKSDEETSKQVNTSNQVVKNTNDEKPSLNQKGNSNEQKINAAIERKEHQLVPLNTKENSIQKFFRNFWSLFFRSKI